MRLNLAGILQGYGVRRAQAEIMKRDGHCTGGLINGSGDVLLPGATSPTAAAGALPSATRPGPAASPPGSR